MLDLYSAFFSVGVGLLPEKYIKQINNFSVRILSTHSYFTEEEMKRKSEK